MAQSDDNTLHGLLIVEDEYLIAASIKMAAEKIGLKVLGIAVQMSDAIRLCEETKPLFATMDLNLAGPESGIEVAAELEEKFGVPSLFVSAYSEDRDDVQAKISTSLGWVSKPFVMRLMQENLETALAKAIASKA